MLNYVSPQVVLITRTPFAPASQIAQWVYLRTPVQAVSPVEMLLICFQQRWWCTWEEEFTRLLGQGCRMNRARSTWGSELCPVEITGMVTLLWTVRRAGMQSLLQDSSLHLLAVAAPGQVLLDESMQWDQPVSTERAGLPQGELHSQGGDLSISHVVKHPGSSKTNMYNPKSIFPCYDSLLRKNSWDWVWVRKWSCAWFLFSPTSQSIFKKWESTDIKYVDVCVSLWSYFPKARDEEELDGSKASIGWSWWMWRAHTIPSSSPESCFPS